MESKSDLKRAFKEKPKNAGIFQIRNLVNGKILLVSSSNLDGHVNGHKFMLKTGGHRNRALQADWNLFGEKQFAFEVVETVEIKSDPSFDLDDELQLLEMVWLDRVRPGGENSYNTDAHIRHA